MKRRRIPLTLKNEQQENVVLVRVFSKICCVRPLPVRDKCVKQSVSCRVSSTVFFSGLHCLASVKMKRLMRPPVPEDETQLFLSNTNSLLLYIQATNIKTVSGVPLGKFITFSVSSTQPRGNFSRRSERRRISDSCALGKPVFLDQRIFGRSRSQECPYKKSLRLS
jgi:hypothetical protein